MEGSTRMGEVPPSKVVIINFGIFFIHRPISIDLHNKNKYKYKTFNTIEFLKTQSRPMLMNGPTVHKESRPFLPTRGNEMKASWTFSLKRQKSFPWKFCLQGFYRNTSKIAAAAYKLKKAVLLDIPDKHKA